MAKRLTTDEKNARAKDKYLGDLAKRQQKVLERFGKEQERQDTQWQKGGDGVGGDLTFGDREAPTKVFRPKKGGGGTYLYPDATQEEVSQADLDVARGKANLAATGASGEQAERERRRGSDNAAEAGRQQGADTLRKAGLGGAADMAENAPGVADWLFENGGATEAPQNVGQWLVNLLGTGTYATARAGESLIKGRERALQAKDPLAGAGELAKGAVDAIGGAARGVAEGFGARFDGERPKTWGQNLEDLGTEKLLKDTLGDEWGGVAQGAVGTAADIGLDPSTYITLGATGIARGAASGARAAAAEGSNFLGKAARGVGGAVKGGVEGGFKRAGELIDAREQGRLARTVRKDAARLSPEEFDARWGGIPEATRQLELEAGSPQAVDDAVEEAAEPQRTFVADEAGTGTFEPRNLDLTDEVAAQRALPATPSDYRQRVGSVEEVQAAARQAQPVVRATDELLPDLQRTVTPEFDAASLLDAGRAAPAGGGRPLLTADAAANVETALSRIIRLKREGGTAAEQTRAVQATMDTLRADPATSPMLGNAVPEYGVTVGEIVEAALRGHRPSQRAVAELPAMRSSEATPVVSSGALAAAVDQVLPGAREALGVSGRQLHQLTARLRRAEGDPARQEAILQRAIGRDYREGYATFRDALAGVARGELAAEDMTRMVAALGIKTRATKPETLQKLLSEQGAATYDEAVAQIPTPEQVHEMFNVTDEVIEQARAIDPHQAMDEADDVAAELDGATDAAVTDIDAPAPRPQRKPVTPARQPAEFTAADVEGAMVELVGRAAYDGVRAFGRLLKDAAEGSPKGNTLTSYTDQVSTSVHRAVVAQLKQRYLKSSGDARGERFLPRYLESMNLVEAWARGQGMWPHLVDNTYGTGNIWASSTQALAMLPQEIVQRAMFAPVRGRGTQAAEGAIGYVNGFTLYPNHVMTGLKAALAGGTPDVVAKAIADRAIGASKGMQRGTDRYVKSFVEKPEGQAALAELADAMTDPRYLDEVRALSDRVKPVAEAINQRYIDGVVARAGERLTTVLRENPDRGTFMSVLDEQMAWATEAARPALLESDRISASVAERLNSAIVKGILGEDGYLTVKHDWTFSRAFDEPSPAQTAARQQAAAEREAARLAGVRPVTRPSAGNVTSRPDPAVTHRATIARAAEREVADAEASAVRTVETEMGYTREELPEQLFGEFDARVSAKMLDQLAMRTSGRTGMTDTWGVRTAAEEGTLAQAAQYTKSMHDWIETVAQRTGRTPAQAIDHINGPIFRALAATSPEAWGSRGRLYTELTTGRATPDTSGTALTEFSVVDALSEQDAMLALELWKFVDHVWNPGDAGLLGRSGLAAADLADASGRYLRDDLASFTVDPGERLVDQAQKWRAWASVASSPLDVLNKTHQAIQAALVPQQIGHSVSAMFSHTALAPGKSTKALYAAGWRKVDTANARNVGKFVDPDAYFPPEILKQLPYLDEFLAASRGFDPNTIAGKLITGFYDPITHVLKSSNTIWRPGHHVTNVLGELGMLVMAGVNPANAYRGVQAIRAGGGLLDADLSKLDEMVKGLSVRGARQNARRAELDEKYAGTTVRVVVKNGRGGYDVQQVPMQEVWRRAANSGVALTHTAARDMVDELGGSLRPQAKWNLLRRGDEALGRFSAHRDNVTRLTHFIDALEKGTYASFDDAVGRAATRVHDYHPTIRTLSRFEQKYARRLVFFYTWVRQAISRVIRTALDQPGFVTMPFKLQYNMAEAGGLNPESIGGPMTDDPRTPSYVDNALLGPTQSGESFLGGLFRNDGEGPENLWQMSLSSPQIDTLDTLFGTFNVTPGTPDQQLQRAGLQAMELGSDVLNPLLAAPLEAFTEYQNFGEGGKGLGELFAESAGTPTALARFLPSGSTDPETGAERSVYSELFPDSTGANKPPAEQAQERLRYLLNFTGGLKIQNATTEAGQKRARRELRDEVKRKLAEQGITDSDVISDTRDYIWDVQMQTQLRG
jgi:hypothetical protein